MFGNVVAGVIATLITAPIISMYLVYLVSVKLTRNKVFALKVAVDVSLIFFMLSVHFFILEIWGISLIGYVLALLLLTAIGFTIVHWKMYEDVEFVRIMKGVWRFQFVLFFVLHFVLMFVGFVTLMYA
ncbi:DUF3397 domain-containing protein [Alteribacter aurantiacus]|uniref:DUF3397 domain-containing protein n=1 Tax=Alteribacter aurantiacus TaxID=254410 RepID=UPI00042070CC|nr:DUF3397 domain-containing protein [Alteribacter aurantiacus]